MAFEDLRKKARQLENEIDSKLMSFSKLATSYGTSVLSNKDEETTSLLSGDQMYEALSVELEQLLNNLADANEKMASATQGSSVAVSHTIKRHRDILQDYMHEFNRTNNSIKARRERELLLGNSDAVAKSFSGLSRRDLYVKEGEHIDNSERMVDEQISIAMETRDHLKNQRMTFKLIQTKVNDFTNRFPLINTLVAKINVKKRRDSLVLGTVIGLCLTFLIWWVFF